LDKGSARSYPAIDVGWVTGDDDEVLGRILVAIDDASPLALHERTHGALIFFATAQQRAAAARSLVDQVPACSCTAVDVPDDDWAARSQASLHAVHIGSLVVAPPWVVEAAAAARENLIVIQPSMGFGTGHHATTRLCLRLLQDPPPVDASVLDAGTGSGVLAIAAAKLGAARVLALDNDPDALISARQNVASNGVGDRIAVQLSDISAADIETFDVVVANLTGALVTRVSSRLGQIVAHGGRVIVSGILSDEREGVLHALTTAGLNLRGTLAEGDWLGLDLQRLPAPRRP
jgi:ribosomal protein L11 methyltransferase